MKYLVIELQTAADGTVGNVVWAYDSWEQAESKYHTVLAAAAISQLPRHAAVMLDSNGGYRNSQCYEHPTQTNEE
jgi:hypothetical protein